MVTSNLDNIFLFDVIFFNDAQLNDSLTWLI